MPAEQILVIPDEQAAVDTALREAQPGDLLLIFGDAITRSWKQVIQFRPEAPARAGGAAAAVAARAAASRRVTAPLMDEGRREFVRDSRGVWLAREEAD